MRAKTIVLISLILLLVLGMSACGGSGSAPSDTTSAGKELFEQVTIGGAAGCRTCHSLEPDTVIVGPSLAGIGETAGTRIGNLSAEDYIQQSIRNPNSYIVEGFPANIMPNVYQKQLTDEQIKSLVDYLLTLK